MREHYCWELAACSAAIPSNASTPLHLAAPLQFKGLQAFPFGTFSCKLEFGSWVYGSTRVNLTIHGEGYDYQNVGSQTSMVRRVAMCSGPITLDLIFACQLR